MHLRCILNHDWTDYTVVSPFPFIEMEMAITHSIILNTIHIYHILTIVYTKLTESSIRDTKYNILAYNSYVHCTMYIVYYIQCGYTSSLTF